MTGPHVPGEMAGLVTEATCIGCGCTDTHACIGGCWWLVVDYDDGTGVCSNCSDYLEKWEIEHPDA